MKPQTALAVLALSLLSFFVFPGHTTLVSDTQIYIPILQHLAHPDVLTRDIMATRPHVAFTVYDEIAIGLHRATGLTFETILLVQQFVYRAGAIAGLLLIGTACGLTVPLASTVAAAVSLGATVVGPAVLVVEYEPVPRGFALSLLLLSMGALAHDRSRSAAAAAALALAFHPPTAVGYTLMLASILVTRARWSAAAILCAGPLLLAASVMTHPTSVDAPQLLARVAPDWEAIQRMRATYNWVGLWVSKWLSYYAVVFAAGLLAWWRIRRAMPPAIRFLALALPLTGAVCVPLSFLLLDRMKLAVAAQFQPARYLLFVTLFAMLLSALAAADAGRRRQFGEAFAFFLVPSALACIEWDPATLTPERMGYVGAAALLFTVAVSGPRCAAVAALGPFLLLPYLARVETNPTLHTPDLQELVHWAGTSTRGDALFQFADVGRGLEPGVLRARALRAVYVDWKGGGQVNFLHEFALIWNKRWTEMRRPLPLESYRKASIDYVVFRATNRQQGAIPAFENAAWIVYDTANTASASARGRITTSTPKTGK